MSHEPMNRRMIRSVRTGAVMAISLVTTTAGMMIVSRSAEAQEIGERRPIEDNTGPGVSVRPGAYFPSRGDMGLSLDANATYGISANPFVIAPGARFAAYFGGNGAVTGMPVVEVMLPVGSVVPYAKAGVGIGHATGPSETSAALMGGAGVDVHVSRDVLLGVDATWETVSGTGFSTVAIGPRASVRY